MRQVGSIAKLDMAERFADYLRAGGIKCTVDAGAEGFRVWVHDDDRVAAAREELPRFLTEPDHQRYLDAGQLAKARLREEIGAQRAARLRTVSLSDKWSRPTGESCPLTFGLIAISLVVAYFTGLDPQHDDPRVKWLWFSSDGTLQPILHGEVWRLISPVFLHFSQMHLVFNLISTWQFGMQIEYRLGTPRFLGMVLVIAILSNFGQFLARGPWFGGMSGVVYGLFGYIWVKGKLVPDSGFNMPQQTVTLMLVWHVICVLGVVSNIANWAHGVGLVTGIVMAFSGSLLKRFERPK